MNIGTITQNASGTYTGKISTLTVAIVIALRTVQSANPRAPKFEILALSAARQWVQVGALFELSSNSTGEMFLNGKIEDPSLDKPLYISAFRQEDGSYNIVWSRPNRRRDAPTDTAASDDGLPPLPGADEPATPSGPAGPDGLGESSAAGAFGSEPTQGTGRRRRTPEMAD
ncbi:DUF736 domain-containing protein [Sphingomonas sp. YL-JM2C]